MNKLLLSLAVLAVPVCLAAQQTDVPESVKVLGKAANTVAAAPRVEEPEVPAVKYWKKSLMTKLDFGQTSLTNWAAGGYNTYSLKTFIDGNLNYAKDRMYWNNRLQLDYGFIYSADKPVLQKSDDRIQFESRWGYKAVENLFLSADYTFKSQFSETYKYVTPPTPADAPPGWEPGRKEWNKARQLQSGFLSPANTNLALGIDYKPWKWLSVNFAPLTGGFVIVSKPELRKAYSMKLKDENNVPDEAKLKEQYTVDGVLDNDAYNIALGNYYRSAKFEFGAQLKVDAKVNVNDNFAYSTQIVLFSDYLDKPQNIRVNWDNRIDWKLTKFFSLTFTTNLIYDDKVKIKNDKDIDKYPEGKQRVQFKESLSFGFVYTFAR